MPLAIARSFVWGNKERSLHCGRDDCEKQKRKQKNENQRKTHSESEYECRVLLLGLAVGVVGMALEDGPVGIGLRGGAALHVGVGGVVDVAYDQWRF